MTNFTARRRMPCDFRYSPQIICRTSKLSSLYLFLGRHSTWFFLLPSLDDLGRLSTNLPYYQFAEINSRAFFKNHCITWIFSSFSHRHLTILIDSQRIFLIFPGLLRSIPISSSWDASWPNTQRLGSVRIECHLTIFNGLTIVPCYLASRETDLGHPRSIRNETTGIECRLFNSYIVYRWQHSSRAT